MSQSSQNIVVVGKGKVGGALGVRLARSGFAVCFALKPGADASELLAQAGAGATAAPADRAAKDADIVFITVPGAVAVEVARSLGDLTGKIVVDCNNPVVWDQGPVWTPPPEGSLTAALAKALPGAHVVKAFNTFGAEFHADPNLAGAPVDVPLAGDNADAKRRVSEVATRAGFHPIDAGPLRNAAVLENLAVLWIHLATVGGQGRDQAFRLVRRSA